MATAEGWADKEGGILYDGGSGGDGVGDGVGEESRRVSELELELEAELVAPELLRDR